MIKEISAALSATLGQPLDDNGGKVGQVFQTQSRCWGSTVALWEAVLTRLFFQLIEAFT